VAAFLLEAGANPNAAGAGYAALHVAATTGDLPLVRALLAHGANPNVRQEKGSPTKRLRSGHALDRTMIGATPFVLAARAAQLEVMRVLAANGADTALPLYDGRTALMVVAGQGTDQGPRVPEARAVEALKLAIQLGTPVNQAAVNGDTALHVAATRRRDAVVQTLVDNGAALEARNLAGETPLAAALKPPPPPKGAGQTVFDDYDYLLTHTGTAELLRKLGAKN
jgi:ankyrin repeat protein